MAALIVSVALGILIILGVYFTPGLPGALPDHNLFSSWEIDFDALGYSGEEVLSMVNSGYLWNAIWLMAYMIPVLGGGLLAAIYRAGGDRGSDNETAPASLDTSAPAKTEVSPVFPDPWALFCSPAPRPAPASPVARSLRLPAALIQALFELAVERSDSMRSRLSRKNISPAVFVTLTTVASAHRSDRESRPGTYSCS